MTAQRLVEKIIETGLKATQKGTLSTDAHETVVKICVDGHCTSNIKVKVIRGELVLHGSSGK